MEIFNDISRLRIIAVNSFFSSNIIIVAENGKAVDVGIGDHCRIKLPGSQVQDQQTKRCRQVCKIILIHINMPDAFISLDIRVAKDIIDVGDTIFIQQVNIAVAISDDEHIQRLMKMDPAWSNITEPVHF